MGYSHGTARRTLSGDRRQNNSQVSTNEQSDWVAEQAQHYSVKQLARLTGLSEKAVENLRMGKSAANSTTITNWCRSDPRFRAEYFAYCGGILQGEPEMEAAINELIGAYNRRKGTE